MVPLILHLEVGLGTVAVVFLFSFAVYRLFRWLLATVGIKI